MNIRLIPFLLAIATLLSWSKIYGQGCIWARYAGGNNLDQGTSVATDLEGNVYVAGSFASDNITFGTFTLANGTSPGMMYNNFFIAKYDPLGNAIWAKSFGGSTEFEAGSITCDVYGNVYAAGVFFTTAMIVGAITLDNKGASDVAIIKMTSSGNVVWAKSFGGSADDNESAVKTDKWGNIYFTGGFASSVIAFDSALLINVDSGYVDGYLVKCDSSGNVKWAKSFSGYGNDEADNLTTDISGNVYVAGHFVSDSFVVGSVVLRDTNGLSDIFLAKLDSAGEVRFAKKCGGVEIDAPTSILINKENDIFISGYSYSPYIIFDTVVVVNPSGGGDYDAIFIAKYDSAGDVIWGKSFGGTVSTRSYGSAIDDSDGIYLAGAFGGGAIECDTFYVPVLGVESVLALKLNGQGKVLWATSMGGTDMEAALSVAVDSSRSIYMTGSSSSATVTFGSNTFTNINPGINNVFLLKLGQPITEISEAKSGSEGLAIYPNPNNGLFTLYLTPSNNQGAVIEVFNTLGGKLAEISSSNTTVEMNLDVPNGLYYLSVKTAKDICYSKIIVSH